MKVGRPLLAVSCRARVPGLQQNGTLLGFVGAGDDARGLRIVDSFSFHRSGSVPRSRSPATSLFLWCLASFVAGNSLMSWLMSDPWGSGVVAWGLYQAMLPAMLGMICGEIALHSVWCALAPLHWAKRLLAGAASAIVLYGSFVAPVFLDLRRHGANAAEVVAPSLCLPLFLLAAQTPLWIMRGWFRWRMAHRDDVSGRFEPWGIKGLLLAMAVIGMALAAARIAQSLRSSSGDDSIVGLAIAALVTVVLSAIAVLPTVAAVLYARRLPMALGAAFAANAAIALGYVVLIAILRGGRFDRDWLITMPVLIGGLFVTLTVPMLIARGLGYRLLCGCSQPAEADRHRPEHPPDCTVEAQASGRK